MASAREPETAEEIRAAILREFRFLTEELGFRETSSRLAAPELSVSFANATSTVTVRLEIGSKPCVAVGRLGHQRAAVFEAEVYSLGFLRQLRAGAPTEQAASTGAPSLTADLRNAAADLRQYASDVLKGDFSVFKEVKALATEELKRREAQHFS